MEPSPVGAADEAEAGPPARWGTVAQGAVLVIAAALRLWRLDQNGFDNEYYAAAVRSMMAGWHTFFYNAFDPAGFVSVDKPPVALWIQVASVKVWGFRPLAVLLPQVLEGVAAVALLAHLVRRHWGPAAGALAGLFLALTPIAVAVDRSGNTDTGLVLVLLAASWALLLAAERGGRGWLLLAMALIGIGFNVKMLAAFVVLPTFALVYWPGATGSWRRRLADLALGGLVLAAVSLPWMIAYDLTPAAGRPYVGSSPQNSMIDLAVGHNGVGRFVRRWQTGRTAQADEAAARRQTAARAPAGSTAAEGYARLFVRAPVGPLRLADGLLAAQAEWLLPLAVVGAAGLWRGGRRRPLAAVRLSLLLWSGWALTYAVVYSWAGGIFHFYYLSTLGPPLAALAAVGAVGLWRRYREGGAPAVALAGALLVTAMWQTYVHATGLPVVADEWQRRLPIWTLLAVALAAGTLLARLLRRGERPGAGAPERVAVVVALGALLLMPAAWALSSVLVHGVAVIPSADIGRLRSPSPATLRARARLGALADQRRLIAFLEANRHGERFLLATPSAQLASPLIIATGLPVMAMGGFHGLDPILTPDRLAELVADGQVRFVMLGELSIASRLMGAEAAGRPLADWIRANGTPVDSTRWSSPSGGMGWPARRELYDLKPGTGLVPAP
ncbi:MAG TPA: glycosyltransferase family 39 protein [Methylomirabilota bacterium]|nr:glycosyltransferase family 39 protein [Methylomirabilota bacterium]